MNPATGQPLKLAIVISGRGSNMLAIARACQSGQILAEVALVLADRDSAGGIAAARELRLPVAVVPAKSYADRSAFEAALQQAIDAAGADLIVLAGFMRILSAAFTTRYAGRTLNIHPALLPAYKGLHTHERVLAAGETWHGASVHYVTSELDEGPTVLQARVPVLPGDDVARLSARVQQQEHIIYPMVIAWIADGRLRWRDAGPLLDDQPLVQPQLLETVSSLSSIGVRK